ncbi:hypothetical protein B711_0336 [Chlamydia psittaci CP3]|nr:hypothetical protein B711_0336 [Chlamydia psittaci CP3]
MIFMIGLGISNHPKHEFMKHPVYWFLISSSLFASIFAC